MTQINLHLDHTNLFKYPLERSLFSTLKKDKSLDVVCSFKNEQCVWLLGGKTVSYNPLDVYSPLRSLVVEIWHRVRLFLSHDYRRSFQTAQAKLKRAFELEEAREKRELETRVDNLPHKEEQYVLDLQKSLKLKGGTTKKKERREFDFKNKIRLLEEACEHHQALADLLEQYRTKKAPEDLALLQKISTFKGVSFPSLEDSVLIEMITYQQMCLIGTKEAIVKTKEALKCVTEKLDREILGRDAKMHSLRQKIDKVVHSPLNKTPFKVKDLPINDPVVRVLDFS